MELRFESLLTGRSRVTSERISIENPTYASVNLNNGNEVDLFRNVDREHSWSWVADFNRGESSDERRVDGCAQAPAAVMKEFYGLTCPPWRTLHARHATKAEKAALRTALLPHVGPLPPGATPRADVHLVNTCISRFDPKWAVGATVFGNITSKNPEETSSAGSFYFFHRLGVRWRVTYIGDSTTVGVLLAPSWNRSLPAVATPPASSEGDSRAQ